MAKFIQIAVDPSPEWNIYALDEDGCVWVLEDNAWVRIVDERYDPATPTKENLSQEKEN